MLSSRYQGSTLSLFSFSSRTASQASSMTHVVELRNELDCRARMNLWRLYIGGGDPPDRGSRQPCYKGKTTRDFPFNTPPQVLMWTDHSETCSNLVTLLSCLLLPYSAPTPPT